jgi:hypothetical protein
LAVIKQLVQTGLGLPWLRSTLRSTMPRKRA